MWKPRLSHKRPVHTADESGSILLWMLGLMMVVLLFAGLVIDIWRAVATDRALSTAADAAASAGANGLDEAAYRRDGTLQLDPARAHDLAVDNLSAQPESANLSSADISATTARVTVRIQRTVPFTLVKVFLPGGLTVTATAEAEPQRS